MGTPVVSTAIGAEGLDVDSGKNIIMADRPHDFAKAIIYLLNHRAEYEKVRKNARLLGKRTYDWHLIAKEAKASIQQILKL